MKNFVIKHIITFEDGTTFEGNALQGTWNEIPDGKKIQKWQYQITEKKSIILENFNAYNHIIKRAFGMQIKRIASIYLLGRNKNQVYRVILNLTTNEIQKDIVEIGKDYNENSHPGWKRGIENLKPKVYIV